MDARESIARRPTGYLEHHRSAAGVSYTVVWPGRGCCPVLAGARVVNHWASAAILGPVVRTHRGRASPIFLLACLSSCLRCSLVLLLHTCCLACLILGPCRPRTEPFAMLTDSCRLQWRQRKEDPNGDMERRCQVTVHPRLCNVGQYAGRLT